MLKRLGFIVAVSLTLTLSACNASREAIINRTSVGLVAARSAFTTEDERQQMAIVEAAQSKLEADAKLAEHRKKRDGATKAFQAAWSALAVASLEPTDANLKRLSELAEAAVATLSEVQGWGTK